MPAQEIRGTDISTLAEVESLGAVFRDRDGTPRDLFELLAERGVNTTRFRLWVDPEDDAGNSYGGGGNDLKTTLELTSRARDAGLDIILDLHYSDFWTDPKKQATPKRWRGLSHTELTSEVYAYTASVLTRFEQEGTELQAVQVGNEITNGMMWPAGQTPRFDEKTQEFGPHDQSAYERLGELFRSGSRAVREHSAAQVLLHLDYGGSSKLYAGWFDRMEDQNLDFDVLGLSYYPFWHGTLHDLSDNLDALAARHPDKRFVIAETAYAHTLDPPRGHHSIFDEELERVGGYPASTTGQVEFLQDLYSVVRSVPNGQGGGIIYWEPAWLPVPGTSWASQAGMVYGDDFAEESNPWAVLGLFSFEGVELPGLCALGQKTQQHH